MLFRIPSNGTNKSTDTQTDIANYRLNRLIQWQIKRQKWVEKYKEYKSLNNLFLQNVTSFFILNPYFCNKKKIMFINKCWIELRRTSRSHLFSKNLRVLCLKLNHTIWKDLISMQCPIHALFYNKDRRRVMVAPIFLTNFSQVTPSE